MRWVVLYLTAGAVVLFVLTALGYATSPELFEHIRERYEGYGAEERRAFWVDELVRPILLWPFLLASTLFAFTPMGGTWRRGMMDAFRRKYLDDERMRQALE